MVAMPSSSTLTRSTVRGPERPAVPSERTTLGSPTDRPGLVQISMSGDDPAQATAFLSSMYAGEHWSAAPTSEPFRFRYAAVGDDRLSLRRSQMRGVARGDATTEKDIVVQWIDHGASRIDVERDEVRPEAGRPAIYPVGRRFRVEYSDCDQRLVHVDRALVLDVAAERYESPEDMAFDHRAVPTAHSVQRWRTSVTTAMHALRDQGPSSLLWTETTRDVASALLELYPPTVADRLPDAVMRPSAARVRAAVDFIHSHAAEPLTVQEIGRSCGLSTRATQESFQRVLGTTPMSYLHHIRLERVRGELLRADPQSTSVSIVARRWGFAHLGRFSAAYAQHFGEYPRESLRR